MLPNLLDDLLRDWDANSTAAPTPPDPPQPPVAANPIESLLTNLLANYETPAPAPAPPPEPAVPPTPAGRKYLAVTLGERRFAAPVEAVLEVGRYPRVSFVPGLPAPIRGVFHFRGEVLPVVDVRQWIGAPPATGQESSRIVTMQSATRDLRAAFVFDTLEGMTHLDPAAAEPATGAFATLGFVDSVACGAGAEATGLLNVELLLNAAEPTAANEVTTG